MLPQAMWANVMLGSPDVALTPSAPVYLYHAINDEYVSTSAPSITDAALTGPATTQIPYHVATTLVQTWCSNGASVYFSTDITPQMEHLVSSRFKKSPRGPRLNDVFAPQAESVAGAPGAISFFSDRFDHVAFPSGCTYYYGADETKTSET